MKIKNRIIVLAFVLASLFGFVSRCYAAETRTVKMSTGGTYYLVDNMIDELEKYPETVFKVEIDEKNIEPGGTYCYKAINEENRKVFALTPVETPAN